LKGRVGPSPARLGPLVEAARKVRRNARAPYSRFRVGAAVLDEQNRIHVGCNLENASYGLTVCAERNAVAAAVASGARQIRAVAVVTDARPLSTPCGACRQVLAEVGGPELSIVLAGPSGNARKVYPLDALLPEAFLLR
jgi:cytidine deaminase